MLWVGRHVVVPESGVGNLGHGVLRLQPVRWYCTEHYRGLTTSMEVLRTVFCDFFRLGDRSKTGRLWKKHT